jgi:DNA-binding IclR family transcriptional regulator
MSLGEIQQATGLPTSTVQRLVSNMVAQGLLDRTGDRIRIGVRMSYWASTALKDLDVLAVVNTVLKEIRDKSGQTACFKVEQNYRVCVAVAETHHALRRDIYVGKVIPLHVGSASRGAAGVECGPCGTHSRGPDGVDDRLHSDQSRRTARAHRAGEG